MRLLLKVAALSTCCLALTAGSCQPKPVLTPMPLPAERIDCVAAGARPTIPPEHVIDWGKVTTVAQARAEHGKFVAEIRKREGVTVGYILKLEGQLFACSNDAQWLREYNASITK